MVLNGQPVEDSRVELKAIWLDAEKAAPRLAGHANASRGESILWLIGVDERKGSVVGVDATEKGNWYKAVEKCFDGFAPRLLVDVNLRVNGSAVVALYFDTALEAPYVTKSQAGGFPEYIVPWRRGTDLRAARRQDLLSLLVPRHRLLSLRNELEFNALVVRKAEEGRQTTVYQRYIACTFETKQFDLAVESGILLQLDTATRNEIQEAYWAVKSANTKIVAVTRQPHTVESNEALIMIVNSKSPIEKAVKAISTWDNE